MVNRKITALRFWLTANVRFWICF
ncbi:hypothetical protein PENSTE_c044G00745 [Penicillium steckii]|uniref:Uncharacterized protein n=1 Tax=Penicillium steckii TaxID=303698 RepID=A0A1V6SIG5_9EURO|nr:hypothetical protein PENSTE_c044G00745 [Penicillium steckii]